MLNRLKARSEGLVEPEEIRRIRKRLHLTQEAAGLLIGGGPRAFQKCESGDLLPSRAISSALVLLDHNPEALAFLKARQASQNLKGNPDAGDNPVPSKREPFKSLDYQVDFQQTGEHLVEELNAVLLNHGTSLFRDGARSFQVFSKPVQRIQGNERSGAVQKKERLAGSGNCRFDLVPGENKRLLGTLSLRNNIDEIPEDHSSVEVRRQPILFLVFMEKSHEVEAHFIVSIDHAARGLAVVDLPVLSAAENKLEMLPQEIGLIQFVF